MAQFEFHAPATAVDMFCAAICQPVPTGQTWSPCPFFRRVLHFVSAGSADSGTDVGATTVPVSAPADVAISSKAVWPQQPRGRRWGRRRGRTVRHGLTALCSLQPAGRSDVFPARRNRLPLLPAIATPERCIALCLAGQQLCMLCSGNTDHLRTRWVYGLNLQRTW